MKKKTNQYSLAKTSNAYFATRVSKLSCGQSFTVPNYGTVKAYRTAKGQRRFSVSGNTKIPNGGNLKPITIVNEIRSGLYFSI